MICFPDTNVVFKLAGFDLLDEALSVLSAAPQDLFLLQETRQMCSGNKMREEYRRQAVTRVEALIYRAGSKSADINPDELVLLSETDGIDGGEAILFAATRSHTEFIVVSDDKNSLRALAEEPECELIFERIQGHVVCIEDLLLRIIAKYSYERIRPKLLLAQHCVKALSQTLGTNQHAGQVQVESALQNAMERLSLETNYILASPSDHNP